MRVVQGLVRNDGILVDVENNVGAVGKRKGRSGLPTRKDACLVELYRDVISKNPVLQILLWLCKKLFGQILKCRARLSGNAAQLAKGLQLVLPILGFSCFQEEFQGSVGYRGAASADLTASEAAVGLDFATLKTCTNSL